MPPARSITAWNPGPTCVRCCSASTTMTDDAEQSPTSGTSYEPAPLIDDRTPHLGRTLTTAPTRGPILIAVAARLLPIAPTFLAPLLSIVATFLATLAA